MIPISIPNLSGNEAAYLAKCVETGFVSSVGNFVGQFADAVAERSNGGFAAPVASGTAALHLSLLAAGIRAGDLVILPSMTFIASANAVSYCGAVPWLMDVSPESWTLDPAQLMAALDKETHTKDGNIFHTSSGRRIAAIMPIFMLGLPADMDPILATAKQYGLPVICDAAAALGARYKNKAVGDLGAFATTYSFNGNKTFTCGGGGAVTSSNESTISGINHLATTARQGPDYNHDQVGFNYRMTNLSAAVGCAQLEQFETFLTRKREIAVAYSSAFQSIGFISSFPSPEWAGSAHWLSGVHLDLPKKDTETFVSKLRESGIDARAFWKPVHLQAPYKHAEKEMLDVTNEVHSKIVPLPCSTELDNNSLDKVIDRVQKAASAL